MVDMSTVDLRYIGPCEEVDVALEGVSVVHGGTITIAAEDADMYLCQPDNWEQVVAADAAPTTEPIVADATPAPTPEPVVAPVPEGSV